KMAEAAAARPEIVGNKLNEIAKQDREILDTLLEVMEVENLLESDAVVDVLPESSNLLVQLGQST
ncbi:MAG: SPFH/Band 7/PHB domain protein, partial [Planctomycetota bacterium]